MPTTTADPRSHALDSIRRLNAIATLPEVTAKIINIVDNPRSTAANLHRIISHDPALVTRILKLVNSSFYGLPGQISSIERAIVLLGLTAVKNVAIAASIGQMFRSGKLCDGFSAKDLWIHCIAVAVGARELAKQMRLPVVEEAFLGGMIHDIGLLVSLQLWPEKLKEVCLAVQAGKGGFCALEREIIGIDHAELGASLAEQWKFPKLCQVVARNHHAPTSLGEDCRQVVVLVHVADMIACHSKLGFNLTAIHQTLDEGRLTHFKVDPGVFANVKANLPTLMETANAVLM